MSDSEQQSGQTTEDYLSKKVSEVELADMQSREPEDDEPTVRELVLDVLDCTLGDEEFRRQAADVVDPLLPAGPFEAVDAYAIRKVLQGGAYAIEELTTSDQ